MMRVIMGRDKESRAQHANSPFTKTTLSAFMDAIYKETNDKGVKSEPVHRDL